jgi:enoyl-CoA hydratase/carnithine racemase
LPTSKSANQCSVVNESQVLLAERNGGTLVLTLNRPGALNALSTELARSLHEAVDAVADLNDIRAIVITGSGGRAFSAGTDLKERRSLSAQGKWAQSRALWDTTQAIGKSPKPVIAAIAGWCLGGGFELSLACDLRIAGRSARFGWPEMSLGAYPGGGAAVMLPRIVGSAKAKAMLFTAGQITSQEAYAMRLVETVVPDTDLLEEALRVSHSVAVVPTKTLGAVKSAVNEGTDLPWSDAVSLDLSIQETFHKSEAAPTS